MDENIKEFYKNYPDKFLEDYLGIKLYWYQKCMIRILAGVAK